MWKQIGAAVLGGIILALGGVYFSLFQDLVELKTEVNKEGFAEELKIHSGIIVPFYGTPVEAEKLAKNGWVICDGRTIADENAPPSLRGKPTPDLVGRFLVGSRMSGEFGGTRSGATSNAGGHSHERLEVGRAGFGDDRNDNQFLPNHSGNHAHSYTVNPPHMTVIYLMYVR
ncbi:MAG: hypothetical protein MI867_19505 [Pseudomonadales bacterium]|nr:hypothetical protein [Pseudomonadales bacterium]